MSWFQRLGCSRRCCEEQFHQGFPLGRDALGTAFLGHCEVFQTDLNKKALKPKEILSLTKNKYGFDLTSNQGINYEIGNFDWFSYEIINSSPDFCFVPYGTGTIFAKLLEINKFEVGYQRKDPRFSGDVKKLRKCNFMAATTKNPLSKADKLYSHHLPFPRIDEESIRFFKQSGFCGDKSGIHYIKENYLDQALKIAHSQGIECEPSGIAGLGLMLQIRNSIPKDKKILIVNTGKTKY